MTSDALLSVTGSATIVERVDPPAGVLTVKLVTKDGDVLAGTAVATGAGPLEFELVTDATLTPHESDLRLWAMLRTEAGVWGTPELVTVRDELHLSRVDRT